MADTMSQTGTHAAPALEVPTALTQKAKKGLKKGRLILEVVRDEAGGVASVTTQDNESILIHERDTYGYETLHRAELLRVLAEVAPNRNQYVRGTDRELRALLCAPDLSAARDAFNAEHQVGVMVPMEQVEQVVKRLLNERLTELGLL